MRLATSPTPHFAVAEPPDSPLDESLTTAVETSQPPLEPAAAHADRLAADFVTDRFFDRPTTTPRTTGQTAGNPTSGADSPVQTAADATPTTDILEELAQQPRERTGWLRTRQTVITLFLWLIMLYPMAVVINSFSSKPLWDFIYHWDYSQGSSFLGYCLAVLVGGLLVVTLGSTVFLLRNNYNERHGYARHATYDEIKAAARGQLMEDIYSERFGPPAKRHSTQAVTIRPEQNLPDHFVAERFEEAGLAL